MKETDQLKKLMETVDMAFADKTKISEDWGSSDDYQLLQNMDKYIDKHGLGPDTIRKAAENEADFYYEIMGYDTAEDAVESIIYSWVHKTERGQQLQKMFAPVEEGVVREATTQQPYDIEFDSEDVTIFTLGGEPVLEMPIDDWIALISKFNRQMGGRQGPG